METQAMRAALADIPLPLLTTENAKILNGVLASLNIIERIESERPLVVLVGPTGAGKSFVFNAIIGGNASPEGVLRPTTSTFFVAGDLPSNHQRRVAHAVSLPEGDTGFTLVDVPSIDGGHPDADDLVADADLVVMVVSPIRYADARVGELWGTLDPSRATVVLNRVATDGVERRDLVASVTETFGKDPYVIGEREDQSASIADHIANQIPARRSDLVAAIMYRSVAAGAKLLVSEVTNAARDIGRVVTCVESIPDCAVDTSRYDIQESWIGTRDEIVKRVAIDIRDRDDDIMRGSGTDLAERLLASIGPWHQDDLVADLDGWRDRCVETFSERSSVRWRRSNAQQLIEQFAWSTAINQRTVAPKRFSRIMRGNMKATANQMQSDLEDAICEYVDARLAEWQAKLERFGDYQPGALASAAGLFERERPVHG